jgi:DNA polymerase/3'-5' exonuclease PolX
VIILNAPEKSSLSKPRRNMPNQALLSYKNQHDLSMFIMISEKSLRGCDFQLVENISILSTPERYTGQNILKISFHCDVN